MHRPRQLLFAIFVLVSAACADCSERQTIDLRTEADLDAVLDRQYAPQVDAGLALLAALDLELRPAMEVTPSRLVQLADASVADLTPSDGGLSMDLLVRDRERARELVGELLDRHVPVWWLEETDGGVKFVVVRQDPDQFPGDFYPPWLPAQGDAIPCLSDCQARVQRILEKRAVLTELSGHSQRLRRLRKLKRDVDEFAAVAPPPAVRRLVDVGLQQRFRPGTQLSYHSATKAPGALRVCFSGLTLAQCQAAFDGGTCSVSEWCRGERCADAPSCGFEVSP